MPKKERSARKTTFSEAELRYESGRAPFGQIKVKNTEAKRCFATHDEDIDYFNMRIYIILIACVYIQQFNFVQ